MFGQRQTRQRRKSPTPPPMTRDEALRISQGLGLLERSQPPAPLLSETDDDADNNNEWEDIPEVPCTHEEIRPDSPGDQYAKHQRSLRRAEARARNQSKWMALEAQLTATYLHLQSFTQNWTKQNSYLTNEIKCQCPPEKFRRRCVDFVDILSHARKRRVTFCDCVPDVIRLLHLGYIAGSPHFPRTAFSIRLLQFQHHLWNHTSISISGFIDALMSFLDVQCPSRLTPQQIKGNYKKNTDAQAKDIKLRELYPDKFIGVLYDIGCHLGAHIAKRLWLQNRYQNAVKVLSEAQSALTILYGTTNPAAPGQNYSAEFFRGQWTLEREAYSSKEAILQRQKLELGRLLSLKEELDTAW
ncbi:uncharacterized protein MELLADRAFT_108934 [Melampsora larici-populina 98AG31]|uniref:CxC1-like cysteine cluster associated with KDZ transposases domain-containing protein n=1 Tax=Melampsora larici-populina (strain 98AG31 / pathotype 3-4-7) TaxID=747676 RepID=F4RUS9_MELLP|nr:uncharacterized protein MELLADRAFT_108934 [Melampsora larici-populina 98AG31]EGG03749.1 hypothetical protein MELLADRAFT_108934 [Melampsora larici-populina 98AG31]